MTKLVDILAMGFYTSLGLILLGFTWLAIAVHPAWFLAAIAVAALIVKLAADDHRDTVEAEAAAGSQDHGPAVGTAHVPFQREPGEF
jgi:hypothetical protein